MTHPVVLVHGFRDTGACFRRMAESLERRGLRAHAPSLTPSTGGTGLDSLAGDLRDYVDECLGLNASFDLVGFSMGGLISRYYLQRLGGIERVRRFITISCPHHGSVLGHLLLNQGGRQLRPGSPFLKDLQRDADVLRRVGIVSIWTPLDLTVVPAWSSRLPFGSDVRIPVPLHPLMLRDRRTIEAVITALDSG